MNPQGISDCAPLGLHQVLPSPGTPRGIPALAVPSSSPGGSAVRGHLSSGDLVHTYRARVARPLLTIGVKSQLLPEGTEMLTGCRKPSFWKGGSTIAHGARISPTCPLFSRYTGKQAVYQLPQGHKHTHL